MFYYLLGLLCELFIMFFIFPESVDVRDGIARQNGAPEPQIQSQPWRHSMDSQSPGTS